VPDLELTLMPDQQFQEVYGFGGAFTDSFGINAAKLSEPARERLLESYFGHSGWYLLRKKN
jgi:glucosylceramidase